MAPIMGFEISVVGQGAQQGCSIGSGLLELGTANQSADMETLNGRPRDECLNDHWFTTLAHAGAVIEVWRRGYSDERPKKSLGGLTPTEYAKQLSTKAVTMR